MKRIVIAAVGISLCAAAGAQQRVKETIISDPAAPNWTFDGAPKAKAVAAAAGVPGGKAVQVAIAQAGGNPWEIQGRLGLKDGFAVDDTVTFGFYARAVKPDPGKDAATVNVRIQRSVAPYDAAVEGQVTIGREWSFVCLAGPAKIALAATEMFVSVQLAGEKRVIDFGPYMATKIPARGPSVKSGLPCGQPVKTG